MVAGGRVFLAEQRDNCPCPASVMAYGDLEFVANLIGERFGSEDACVATEAENPTLKLDGAAELERDDRLLPIVVDDFLAVVPHQLADVRRGPAGELGADFLLGAGVEDAERAL